MMPMDAAAFGLAVSPGCFGSMDGRTLCLADIMVGSAILTELNSYFPIVRRLLTLW
jgi:hypothetical protein